MADPETEEHGRAAALSVRAGLYDLLALERGRIRDGSLSMQGWVGGPTINIAGGVSIDPETGYMRVPPQSADRTVGQLDDRTSRLQIQEFNRQLRMARQYADNYNSILDALVETSDLESPDLAALPESGAGEITSLYDSFGHFLGRGFYNPQSRIAFRLITRHDIPINEDFWKEKLMAAIQYRENLKLEGTAKRLVFSEADGFPGLIIDQYNDCIALQIMSIGMESSSFLWVSLSRSKVLSDLSMESVRLKKILL